MKFKFFKIILTLLIILAVLMVFRPSGFSNVMIDYENIKNKKINDLNLSFTQINLSIPKIIHKIYIDKTMELGNIDPSIYNLFNKIKKMNPGYILKIYSGNDCRNYLINNFPPEYINCFDNLEPYAYKADFFRYCVVYNEGGWYSDLKEDPLVRFDTINNNDYSFIGVVDLGIQYCLDNFSLQNAFFAAVKNHPLLKNCMESVIKNCKNKFYGNNNLEPTGPRLFGNELEKINSLPDNVLFGYYIHDIPGGSHFFNNEKMIIHKCSKCTKGNEWEYGNNWQKMWSEKRIYTVKQNF